MSVENDIIGEETVKTTELSSEVFDVTKYMSQQNDMLKDFFEQQTSCLEKLGYRNAEEPVTKKRKNHASESPCSTRRDEDAISVHVDSEVDEEIPNDEMEDDPWEKRYSKSHIGNKGGDSDDDDADLEGILSSRYKSLMEQTEEIMGEPIDDGLAKVCKKTWGKAILSVEKKKELLKEINIPSNCPQMQTPKLNTEVYIRIPENGQTKDRAAQERQKDIAKTAVPLFKALGQLEKAESLMEKSMKRDTDETPITKAEKQAYKALKGVLPLITQSVKVLNYNFTETSRKRKYDVCGAMGPQFKPFASGDTSDEFLFGPDTQKRMKTELTNLKIKGKGKYTAYPSTASKNFQGSGKAPRSYSGYNQYNQYNQSRNLSNNHNNNNNNNNNNKFNNNKFNNNNYYKPGRRGRGK